MTLSACGLFRSFPRVYRIRPEIEKDSRALRETLPAYIVERTRSDAGIRVCDTCSNGRSILTESVAPDKQRGWYIKIFICYKRSPMEKVPKDKSSEWNAGKRGNDSVVHVYHYVQDVSEVARYLTITNFSVKSKSVVSSFIILFTLNIWRIKIEFRSSKE